jgi:transposase
VEASYPPIPMLKALLCEYLKELPSHNQLVKWLRRQENKHWARCSDLGNEFLISQLSVISKRD